MMGDVTFSSGVENHWRYINYKKKQEIRKSWFFYSVEKGHCVAF